jgi:hypothetical protein
MPEMVVTSYQSPQATIRYEMVVQVSDPSQYFHFLATVLVKQMKPVVRHILQTDRQTDRQTEKGSCDALDII